MVFGRIGTNWFGRVMADNSVCSRYKSNRPVGTACRISA